MKVKVPFRFRRRHNTPADGWKKSKMKEIKLKATQILTCKNYEGLQTFFRQRVIYRLQFLHQDMVLELGLKNEKEFEELRL